MLLRIVLVVGLCTLVFQQHSLGAEQSWNNLMLLAHDNVKANNLDQAQSLLLAALAQAETFGSRDPRLSASLRALADLYVKKKQFAKAEALYQRELKTFDGLGEHYPDRAHVWLALARVSEESGNYREAERYYRKLLARKNPIHTEKDCEDRRVIWALGRMNAKQKKFDEAERYYLKALSMASPRIDESPMELVELANAMKANGKYEEAEAYYRRVLKMCQKSTGQEPVENGLAMAGLAEGLMDKPGVRKQKDSKEVETLMVGALTIFDRYYGTNSHNSAQLVKRLARLYFEKHDYDRSEAFCKRGLAIYEKLDPAGPQMAALSGTLAQIYRSKGGYVEAEVHYKRAVEIFGNLPSRRKQYEAYLHSYADLLRMTGRKAEADRLIQRKQAAP